VKARRIVIKEQPRCGHPLECAMQKQGWNRGLRTCEARVATKIRRGTVLRSKDCYSSKGANGDNYCCFLSRPRHAYWISVVGWNNLFSSHRRLVNARITGAEFLHVSS
jgi:hypothetical protein